MQHKTGKPDQSQQKLNSLVSQKTDVKAMGNSDKIYLFAF